MRPKERLLRKRIPKDAIRKSLEQWSDRLSHWNQFFTAVLVLGLVIEYLPEIVYFLPVPFGASVRSHTEQLREFGGLLVILGVLGEFWIGFRESRVESDLREEYNSTIAELHERAAKAEKDAAEANLARVKIEQRMQPRFLTAEDLEKLRVLLTSHPLPSYPRMGVDVIVFDHHMRETRTLAGQITSLFDSINWVVRQWDSGKATRRIEGSSVLVALAVEHVNAELVQLAAKFATFLTGLGIDCSVEPNSFGCIGELNEVGYELRFEKYLKVTGLRGVAPFRIQIGAKQLAAFPPPQIVWVEKA